MLIAAVNEFLVKLLTDATMQSLLTLSSSCQNVSEVNLQMKNSKAIFFSKLILKCK